MNTLEVWRSCGNSFGMGHFSSYEEKDFEGREIPPGAKPGDFLGVGYASAGLYVRPAGYTPKFTRENPELTYSGEGLAYQRALLAGKA